MSEIIELTEADLYDGTRLLMQAMYEAQPTTGMYTAVPIYVEQKTAIKMQEFYERFKK